MFGVHEMVEEPLFDLLEPDEVFLILRERIGQKRRVDRLVLRPPELEFVLVLVGLMTFRLIDVAEVDDAAVTLHLVPPPVEGPVENGKRFFEKLIILLVLRLFHCKPARLNRVTGIDCTAFRRVARSTIGIDYLTESLLFVVEERGVDLLEAGGNRLVVERRVSTQLAHHDRRAGDDHRDVVRPHLARRIELRRQEFGVVVVHHDRLVQLLGLLFPDRILSGLVQLDIPHHRVVFGDDITALAHGTAVFGDIIVGTAITLVKAVVLNELHSLKRKVKPLLPLFDLIVCPREKKHETPLLTDVLVGEKHLAVATQVIVESAILHIWRVLLPPLH